MQHTMSQLGAIAVTLLLLTSSPAAVYAEPPTSNAVSTGTILSVAQGANLKLLVAAIGAIGGPLLAAVQNTSTAGK